MQIENHKEEVPFSFYEEKFKALDPADVVALTKETLAFIADYEGEIPGNTAAECGNYLEHDLPAAKAAAAQMRDALASWKTDDLVYPQ